MRTRFWYGIGVLASIAAGAGVADAADLPVKAPVYNAPPPVILSDWAGFYIGINGGGGWANNKFDLNNELNGTASGGLVGGHAGYNWQYGNVVAGIEVDFDGADLKKTVTGVGFSQTQKTDELSTARARLGYIVLPNLLAYGTAGAGFGHLEVNDTLGDNDAVNTFGWVAGAGLEYKVFGPLIGRVEYLHYDFGKTSLPQLGDNIKESVDAVRGGLSYKF
jgi:opacity protein-like surface antigen